MNAEAATDPSVDELRAVLARVITAVLTVDRLLHVHFANPAARTLLQRGDGLRMRDGRLSAVRSGDTRALARSVSDVLANTHGMAPDAPAHRGPARSRSSTMLSVARDDAALSYRVVACALTHLPTSPTRGGAEAVLFVEDPDDATAAAALQEELLQQTFGLTAAEARVAVQLAAGATLVEAAASSGVTHNTVRTQLRGVFDKTGARRQADLVRLLHGCQSLRLSLN